MTTSPNFKLSFGSVNLDSDDIKILENGEWFNDKLLTFIGEYLMESANEKWKEWKGENLMHVFTPPETEMIRHSNSEESEMFFGMLGVDKIRIVAFIMNNNTQVHVAHGGSHWSLLVFDRQTDKFRHFDSVTGTNHHVAVKLMEKTRHLVGQKRVQKALEVEKVLQQTNSRDCGLMAAGYLWAMADNADVNAIQELKSVIPRSSWLDFVHNFSETHNFFPGSFKNS